MTHETWIAEIAAARKKFEDQNLDTTRPVSLTRRRSPGCDRKGASDFLYRGKLPKEQTTVVSGGYGIAVGTQGELRGFRPGQIMNGAYQYGAIGPDVGYSVGVAAAVRLGAGPQKAYKGHPIICMTGDAGFGYTAMEIDTISKYRLPVVAIVYNNNAWGTWTGATADPKAMPIHLFQENLRYDKLAEALGGHGEYVTRPAEFRPALERAYQVAAREGRPSVINCQGKKEFWIAQSSRPERSARSSPVRCCTTTERQRSRCGHGGVFTLRRPRRLSRLSAVIVRPWTRRLPVSVADPAADARVDRSARHADLPCPAAAGLSGDCRGDEVNRRRTIHARRTRSQAHRCAARQGWHAPFAKVTSRSSVDIRGRNQEYAVRKALNLVNEMFVALHEGHPEYLVQHFGISQE